MKKTSKHNSEPLATALNYLSGRYVLPSFQRDYVWKMEQIEELFNSIYRGYPLGAMLLWRINSSGNSPLLNESFYQFLFHYHEEKSNHAQNKISLLPNVDYWVVLDGQQRLTSLNIGLLGSYSKRARYQRKDNPDYPEYKLYMLISKDVENPFKFLKVSDIPTVSDCFPDKTTGEKWLLVKRIFMADKARDLTRLFHLSTEEEDRVTDFKESLDNLKIEFSEMTGFDYNEATNVFVKVNSGGTILAMSDILNSIIVSTWKTENAREAFKDLVEKVANMGFSINTNYIVKSILFLHHTDVRFQIQGFTDFVVDIEKKWSDIKTAIIETFSLLKSYGLNHSTLGGYNVTMPVLYYIYHRHIQNPATAASFAKDKQEIKKWLLSAILKKVFGGSSDSTLRTVRSVFTEKKDIQKINTGDEAPLYSPSISDYVIFPMKLGITSFPSGEMKQALGDEWYISDETIAKLVTETQKGDRYSLPILSLLYPDYDLTAVEYEQDHLHPMARYQQLPSGFATKENKPLYNSIVNLQLLQKTPNIQKGDKPLKDWVSEQTQGKDKKPFLDEHLIPDVLEEKDIADFFDKRKELLIERLQNALK